MKKIIICLALCASTLAHADDLADANKAMAAKAYPQALKLYTKLAEKGNAEAQFHLGEMYLYGEAGAIDLPKAGEWFRKAAASGHKKAGAALDMMKQREVRRADIDYWITKYDGAELRSGQYRCPAPRFPAVSKSNQEIEAVDERMRKWQECYNAFATHLNEQNPPSKRIPKEVLDLMTEDELKAAVAHITEAQSLIADSANSNAKIVLADFNAWRSATETWVKENNIVIRNARAADGGPDAEARRNNYAPKSK